MNTLDAPVDDTPLRKFLDTLGKWMGLSGELVDGRPKEYGLAFISLITLPDEEAAKSMSKVIVEEANRTGSKLVYHHFPNQFHLNSDQAKNG